MIKPSITPQDVVDLLNEALRLDPEAITNLTQGRVLCNRALTDHPTVRTRPAPAIMVTRQIDLLKAVEPESDSDGNPVPQAEIKSNLVGVLGLLNGMFGVGIDGRGPITVQSDAGDGEVRAFLLTSAL